VSLWRRVFAERRAVVVPLASALVINLLVFGLAVLPLSRSVTGDQTRAEDVKRLLADAHRVARIASDTKNSQVQAGEELQKFYSEVLPANLSAARSLLYLEIATLAKETGLIHSTSVFTRDDVEDVENSLLVRFGTNVSLTGEYAAIRRFLYHMETSEQFFVIESVKLGQVTTQQTGGVLEVVLQVATYYSRNAPTGVGQ
jgi:Tfp pilus assembly protein PilO